MVSRDNVLSLWIHDTKGNNTSMPGMLVYLGLRLKVTNIYVINCKENGKLGNVVVLLQLMLVSYILHVYPLVIRVQWSSAAQISSAYVT